MKKHEHESIQDAVDAFMNGLIANGFNPNDYEHIEWLIKMVQLYGLKPYSSFLHDWLYRNTNGALSGVDNIDKSFNAIMNKFKMLNEIDRIKQKYKVDNPDKWRV